MSKLWSIFFGLITVSIVTSMMLPSIFGLQQFTQWGGMYSDGWCNVTVASAPLKNPAADEEGIERDNVLAGQTSRVVWFAPMHSFRTCVAWARSWCKKSSGKVHLIRAVYPYYREQFLLDGQNICTLPDHPSFAWFRQK